MRGAAPGRGGPTLLLLKRGDKVLQEEVRAGLEGYGVLDRGAQRLRVLLDRLEGLEDGGVVGGGEKGGEGADGGHGFRDVMIGEMSVVLGDDTGEKGPRRRTSVLCGPGSEGRRAAGPDGDLLEFASLL